MQRLINDAIKKQENLNQQMKQATDKTNPAEQRKQIKEELKLESNKQVAAAQKRLAAQKTQNSG